jgi:O-antigen/teichoic acid export membrane protein
MEPIENPLSTGAYFRGAALAGAGALAARGALFINVIVAARLLTAEEFGAYALLLSFGAMVGTMARFGLSVAVCRLVASKSASGSRDCGALISTGLWLWLASAAAVLLLASVSIPCLAERVYERPGLESGLFFFAIFGLLQALYHIAQGIVQGFRAFGIMAAANAAAAAFMVASHLALVLWRGYQGAVEAAVAGMAACAVSMLVAARAAARPQGGMRISMPFPRHLKRLASYALPLFVSSLFNYPVVWLGASYLSATAGFAEFGRFSAANIFRLGLLFVVTALSAPVLPHLAPMADREELSKYRHGILGGMRILLLASVLLAAAALLLFDVCLAILGKNYLDTRTVLSPLMIASVLGALAVVPGLALVTGRARRVWLGAASNALWAAAFGAGVLLFIGRHGAEGLALAYAGSYAVLLPALLAYLALVLEVPLHRLLKPGLVAAVAMIFAVVIGNLCPVGLRAAALAVLMLFVARGMLTSGERARAWTGLKALCLRIGFREASDA